MYELGKTPFRGERKWIERSPSGGRGPRDPRQRGFTSGGFGQMPPDPRLDALRADPRIGPVGPLARRRRRRGDVRLALLMLLTLDGPRNGYQLMRALEDRSDGRWRPSPGSIYPALGQLEQDGLIHSTPVDGEASRVYELTDAGREIMNEREPAPAPWEPEGDADDARSALFKAVGAAIRAARQAAQDGDATQIEKVTELFTDTRRGIYRVLAGDEPTAAASDARVHESTPKPAADEQ
jgi:DNA-binding PadR family transcriptional regulator